MRLSELYDLGLVRSYRFDPRNKPDVKKQAQLEQARLSVNQQIEVQWIAIMNRRMIEPRTQISVLIYRQDRLDL